MSKHVCIICGKSKQGAKIVQAVNNGAWYHPTCLMKQVQREIDGYLRDMEAMQGTVEQEANCGESN